MIDNEKIQVYNNSVIATKAWEKSDVSVAFLFRTAPPNPLVQYI